MEVVEWKPTEKQEIALSSTADEVLFGGSRGGGKTDAALRWFMYDIHNPKLRGLVIRRNADDLKDFVDRARQIYSPLGASVTGKPSIIKFPSGAIIYTGHLATEDAFTKYQGWEIHRLLVEEVTHIPYEEQYEKLLGSVRSTVPNLQCQVLLTTNPNGMGHDWVKKRFGIDNPKTPPMKKFFKRSASGQERSYIYVPATIHDNKHLYEADPQYVAYLESLPPELRAQWLYGSWDDIEIEGAYYTQQINYIQKQGKIGEYPYRPDLPVYTSWDLGINDANAIWFGQTPDDGETWYFIDYYENSNLSMREYIAICKDKGYDYIHNEAPHDMGVREYSSGKTRLQTAQSLGWNFHIQSKGISKIDGINGVREFLMQCRFNLSTTEQGINALRKYRRAKNADGAWKNDAVHDIYSNGADSFRYFANYARRPSPLTPKLNVETRYKRKTNKKRLM